MRHIVQTALIVLGAVVADSLTTNNGVTYLPFICTASSMLAWTAPRPLRLLAPLALLTELFTATAPGVVTAIMLAPLVVRKIRPRTEIDVAFSFAGLITLTTLAQLTLWFIGSFGFQPLTIAAVQQYQPPLIATAYLVIATSVAVFVASIAIVNLWPDEQRSIVSLEGRRVSR